MSIQHLFFQLCNLFKKSKSNFNYTKNDSNLPLINLQIDIIDGTNVLHSPVLLRQPYKLQSWDLRVDAACAAGPQPGGFRFRSPRGLFPTQPTSTSLQKFTNIRLLILCLLHVSFMYSPHTSQK
jgi:hypothetical protein